VRVRAHSPSTTGPLAPRTLHAARGNPLEHDGADTYGDLCKRATHGTAAAAAAPRQVESLARRTTVPPSQGTATAAPSLLRCPSGHPLDVVLAVGQCAWRSTAESAPLHQTSGDALLLELAGRGYDAVSSASTSLIQSPCVCGRVWGVAKVAKSSHATGACVQDCAMTRNDDSTGCCREKLALEM
jgi:hypothetical protein